MTKTRLVPNFPQHLLKDPRPALKMPLVHHNHPIMVVPVAIMNDFDHIVVVISVVVVVVVVVLVNINVFVLVNVVAGDTLDVETAVRVDLVLVVAIQVYRQEIMTPIGSVGTFVPRPGIKEITADIQPLGNFDATVGINLLLVFVQVQASEIVTLVSVTVSALVSVTAIDQVAANDRPLVNDDRSVVMPVMTVVTVAVLVGFDDDSGRVGVSLMMGLDRKITGMIVPANFHLGVQQYTFILVMTGLDHGSTVVMLVVIAVNDNDVSIVMIMVVVMVVVPVVVVIVTVMNIDIDMGMLVDVITALLDDDVCPVVAEEMMVMLVEVSIAVIMVADVIVSQETANIEQRSFSVDLLLSQIVPSHDDLAVMMMIVFLGVMFRPVCRVMLVLDDHNVVITVRMGMDVFISASNDLGGAAVAAVVLVDDLDITVVLAIDDDSLFVVRFPFVDHDSTQLRLISVNLLNAFELLGNLPGNQLQASPFARVSRLSFRRSSRPFVSVLLAVDVDIVVSNENRPLVDKQPRVQPPSQAGSCGVF